jgi:DNA-binding response OmpR family regulator
MNPRSVLPVHPDASTESEATGTRRILVIEDDPGVRGLLKERLSDAYEIIETGEAAEALGLAMEHNPDCILLDLMMPGFSGLELCQTLSTVSQTQSIPIFVITGQAAEDHRDYCLNLGAREFFEKPIDFARLRASLAKAFKEPQKEKRTQPRIRLKVILKLRGIGQNGKEFELLTSTEDVSAGGFLCRCSVAIDKDELVQVSLMSAEGERHVGSAQLIHIRWPDLPWQACGFRFIEKNSRWIL